MSFSSFFFLFSFFCALSAKKFRLHFFWTWTAELITGVAIFGKNLAIYFSNGVQTLIGMEIGERFIKLSLVKLRQRMKSVNSANTEDGRLGTQWAWVKGLRKAQRRVAGFSTLTQCLPAKSNLTTFAFVLWFFGYFRIRKGLHDSE